MAGLQDQFPELFQRGSRATEGGMMDELARLRMKASQTEGERLRTIRQQQEQVLGPETSEGPSIEENVIQYYRNMGIPDEIIFRELGVAPR